MPSQIELAAQRFRAELLRHERQAATAMVQVYGESWQRVRVELTDLQTQIAAARAQGPVEPAWIFQRDRLDRLQRQIERELAEFIPFAEGSTLATQRFAVDAALSHSQQLMQLALGPVPSGIEIGFSRLPREAVESLIGFASNGSPLRMLFDGIGSGITQGMIDELSSGIALGRNPRVIAQAMRRRFGLGLVRALRISRTETMRAYREATLRNYQANSDVVEGWIWCAALSARTCAACWAMHGTEHSLKETLDDHVNGRCTQIPKLKPWKELGIDATDQRPVVAPGVELFATLESDTQRRILGPAAFEAYSAGAVKLQQFVGRKRSRQWGTMRYAKSLRQIVGDNQAARWIEIAA